MDKEEIIKYCLTLENTYKDCPFSDDFESVTMKHCKNKKWFALLMNVNNKLYLNVKTDPNYSDILRNTYDYIIPAYHMNKEHWNTIILDGSIPENEIQRMISESYDLITDSPTKRIYEAVKKIPKGHVATYGKVAELAGDAKMARAVGNALHKNPDPDHIPCFRVVNAKGELAGAFAFGGADVQAELLREDGVEVVDGKVDLTKYQMADLMESDGRACYRI